MNIYPLPTLVAVARSLSPFYRELYANLPADFQLADLPVVFAANETNMEELLNQEPDLVLYATRYGEDTLKQLQDLGIAAVSASAGSTSPTIPA